MQQLTLTYYQRIIIWNMVGAHQAPNLKEVATFLRLIEKVRLSDQETIESDFKTGGGGQVSWQLPSATYGSRQLDLENEEAASLLAVINSAPVRVNDGEWLLKVAEELDPKNQVKNDKVDSAKV